MVTIMSCFDYSHTPADVTIIIIVLISHRSADEIPGSTIMTVGIHRLI